MPGGGQPTSHGGTLEVWRDHGLHGKLTQVQFVSKATTIRALKQARPKVAMDLDGSTDEVLGETLMIKWHDPLRAPSVDFVPRWWTRSSLLPM